jgi:2-amino-1-hydroxyethylphosphonate dioxygenase (glycine-forming)
MDPLKITNELIQLLEERGTGDYIGESISQLEHCLQCANFGLKSGIPPFIYLMLRPQTYEQ